MRTGDWPAYGASLHALLKKYPRGWESASAVALLADQVDARLQSDGTPVFPAGFRPEPATRDALAAVFRLSPTTGPNHVMAEADGGALWVLPPVAVAPTSSRYDWQTSALSRPEVKQLGGSGLAALPTLAAMAADETPVLLSWIPWIMGGSSYSAQGTAEAKRARLYADLPRPMTRGELVRVLIWQVIPDEWKDVAGLTPESLVMRVEAFVAEHGKSDPVALALVYLETGRLSQQKAALRYLIDASDPRSTAGVETWLLASDLEGQLGAVKAYLRKDPAKKKVFAKKIEARLRENLALPNVRPEREYSPFSRGGVTRLSRQELERDLTEIAGLASGKTVRERLLDAADTNAAALSTLLHTVDSELQGLSVGARVSLLLEVAERAKDPEARYALLIRMAKRVSHSYGGVAAPSGYVLPAFDSDEARRWRFLFEDSRRLNRNSNVGEVAAMVFENLFEPVPPAIAFIFTFGDSPRGKSMVLRRACARLAGEPVPVYPDVSRVTPARLQARVEELAATPDDRWASVFASGNEDDDLALQLWWAGILNPRISMTGVSFPEVDVPPALTERMRRLGEIPTHD